MRAMNFPLFLRCSLAALLVMAGTATRAADLEAWIDTDAKDGILQAVPKIRVANPVTIRFELSAKKTGGAGTSSTRQAGTRAVACCDPVSLSTLRLSAGPADTYTLSLIVYVGNDVAAQVEVRYPEEK